MALPATFQPKQGGKYTMSGLKSGDTVKIRILSDFVTGLVTWSDLDGGSRRPFRVPEGKPMPTAKIGTNPHSGQPERVRQFIAAVCYNYDSEQIEVFETDKTTIIGSIFNLEKTDEFGDSKGYDIKISKKGSGMDTEYIVVGLPPKPASKDVLEAFKNENIVLEALFVGADPFNYEKDENEPVKQKTSKQSEDIADDIPF